MAMAWAFASLLGCFPPAWNASLACHLHDLPIPLALAPADVASTPFHPFAPETWLRARWFLAIYHVALLHRFEFCIARFATILGTDIDRSGTFLLSGVARRSARGPRGPGGQLAVNRLVGVFSAAVAAFNFL